MRGEYKETIVRKSSLFLLSAILGTSLLFGCSTNKASVEPETASPGEKLLWSTHTERPDWCAGGSMDTDGDTLQFRAISDKYSTERYAREDAEQASRKMTVRYTGNLVRASVQNILEQEGSATDTLDPDRVQQEFERQLTNGGISQLASTTWHLEKWLDSRGKVYWKAFLLSEIPRDELDRCIDEFIKTQRAQLEAMPKEDASIPRD
jgi:hypothetical protein